MLGFFLDWGRKHLDQNAWNDFGVQPQDTLKYFNEKK